LKENFLEKRKINTRNYIRWKKMGFNERRGSRDFGPREMHKAVCADCGQECEVPFKPIEGKPVYCKECYQKHRPERRRF